MATSTREIPKLEVHRREKTGTRHSARLRETGRIPAVVYGHGQAPLHICVPGKEIFDLLHHNAHLLQLQLDGGEDSVLIKDVQWNHLGTEIVHVDLTRVDLNEKVTTSVGIEFVGEAIGTKSGGAYLEHRMDELEIECLASEIPDSIRVDVSGLNIGDELTVGQLSLPSGITTTDDADSVVAGVYEVSEEVEAEADAAAANVEPEVIGKKAEEGEEEEKEEK